MLRTVILRYPLLPHKLHAWQASQTGSRPVPSTDGAINNPRFLPHFTQTSKNCTDESRTKWRADSTHSPRAFVGGKEYRYDEPLSRLGYQLRYCDVLPLQVSRPEAFSKKKIVAIRYKSGHAPAAPSRSVKRKKKKMIVITESRLPCSVLAWGPDPCLACASVTSTSTAKAWWLTYCSGVLRRRQWLWWWVSWARCLYRPRQDLRLAVGITYEVLWYNGCRLCMFWSSSAVI